MPATETTERLRLVRSRKSTAQDLDISIDTVDELVARGELERVQLGPRKVGITYRSIVALVERGLRR